jgi:hypothetical protein
MPHREPLAAKIAPVVLPTPVASRENGISVTAAGCPLEVGRIGNECACVCAPVFPVIGATVGTFVIVT